MTNALNICLVGGTGFVGRHLAQRLVALGHRVKVITRRRERHRDMLVLPTISLEQGDVHDPAVLATHFERTDVVVNLVGILNERGRDGRGFEAAHFELSRKVVDACQQTGVWRLLHMSALHAAADGPSHYLRTKGRGEDHVHAAAGENLAVTSFRPSVIFGHDDSFTNRFAQLLRAIPFVFPLACPQARFQPVFVDDVVDAFIGSLTERRTFGERYNLCGPEPYSLHRIVEFIATLIGVRRRIIALSPRLSRWQAMAMEYVPGKPFSVDNFNSMTVDSVCEGPFPEIFAATPQSMETIVPGYLRPQGARLDELRRRARR